MKGGGDMQPVNVSQNNPQVDNPKKTRRVVSTTIRKLNLPQKKDNTLDIYKLDNNSQIELLTELENCIKNSEGNTNYQRIMQMIPMGNDSKKNEILATLKDVIKTENIEDFITIYNKLTEEMKKILTDTLDNIISNLNDTNQNESQKIATKIKNTREQITVQKKGPGRGNVNLSERELDQLIQYEAESTVSRTKIFLELFGVYVSDSFTFGSMSVIFKLIEKVWPESQKRITLDPLEEQVIANLLKERMPDFYNEQLEIENDKKSEERNGVNEILTETAKAGAGLATAGLLNILISLATTIDDANNMLKNRGENIVKENKHITTLQKLLGKLLTNDKENPLEILILSFIETQEKDRQEIANDLKVFILNHIQSQNTNKLTLIDYLKKIDPKKHETYKRTLNKTIILLKKLNPEGDILRKLDSLKSDVQS